MGWIASLEDGDYGGVDLHVSQDEAVARALERVQRWRWATSVIEVRNKEGLVEFSWEILKDLEAKRGAKGGLEQVRFNHGGRPVLCSAAADAIASFAVGGQARAGNTVWDVHVNELSVGSIEVGPDESTRAVRDAATRLIDG